MLKPEVSQTLTNFGQSHLLRFWDSLSDQQKAELVENIDQMNVAQSCAYFERCTKTSTETSSNNALQFSPIEESHYGSASLTSELDLDFYMSYGITAIANGEVGVILMAGGQGTRLGVDYPKGMYNVGLPSGKSLFQLQAERILRLQHLAKVAYPQKNGVIQWYIMVSVFTRKATIDFFVKNSYFGLRVDQVVFFDQGLLPCFSMDGKILMDSSHTIAKAPDGNGGLYSALLKFGIIDSMKAVGVKHVHAYCVDNVLARVADPVFIGFCIAKEADCAAKVVAKVDPTEPIGVVCSVQGTGPSVVEYSEMSKELSELRDSSGTLSFKAGNIANHYFSLDFLVDVTKHIEQLPHHVAKKKIPFVDDSQHLIKPSSPNGIKMEKFVFDVFQLAKKFFVWEVDRNLEFSPLKNSDAAGVDCPSSCCRDVFRISREFLKNAGIFELPPNAVCEISPLVSYAGESLSQMSNALYVPGEPLVSP